MNITPALQIDDKKNLSAEEFQKQLYSWLESRGLLCELRAYFRSNMIEVLKNTTLGTTLSCKVKQTISPKMQAMNLLISEYFIYSQYHFSLCVFCTEVSLNNILQNSNGNSAQTSKEKIIFKFSEKEVYDILEAMGISSHNQRAQKIYSSYCKLNEPLISYFVPLNSLANISYETFHCLEDVNDGNWKLAFENIDKVLLNSNMSPTEKSRLKHYIKLIYQKQHEDHLKVIDNLKDQFKTQLKKYKNKLSDIQKSFNNERKALQDDIVLMRRELEDLQIQNQLMRKDHEKIQCPKTVNEQAQQTEVATGEEKCTQCNEELKEIFKSNKEQQTVTNNPRESAVLQHVVQQLERENTNLRMDNFNHCQQIDELANRASVLISELNKSQQHVAHLNNLLQNSTSVFTPTTLLKMQNQIPHYTGAGEECSGGGQRATPSNYRHLNRPKKSPTKKVVSSSENSSGTVTPTDDLLLEAKRKLRNLELESEDIDRKIRSFTQRYNFTPSMSQTKHGGAGEKSFKFNNEHGLQRDEVFEFGGSGTRRNSNADTDHESQTSLVPPSTSNENINQSDVYESGRSKDLWEYLRATINT